MLVLKRRVDEVIWISPGITIRVLEVAPYVVKLGIEAPEETRVLRGELLVEEDRPDV
jgi:carbon storage regulator CsrA